MFWGDASFSKEFKTPLSLRAILERRVKVQETNEDECRWRAMVSNRFKDVGYAVSAKVNEIALSSFYLPLTPIS